MITMSEAATNSGSSSEDDGNDGPPSTSTCTSDPKCIKLQGIYYEDERFAGVDYINIL